MKTPWNNKLLKGWDIVGMNHYYHKKKRHLFVAMVKDDRCIRAEGEDEDFVWKLLEYRACISNYR